MESAKILHLPKFSRNPGTKQNWKFVYAVFKL